MHGWPLYQALTGQLGGSRVLGICPPKTKLVLFPEGNVRSCCINDVDGLTEIFDQFQPTDVIHTAGMCDLDVCELWPSMAYQRNVEGTENIVSLSRDCSLMYVSTDLVFSGYAPPETGYDESYRPDPIGVIGKTFVQAEQRVAELPRHLIVRKGLPMGDSMSRRKGPVDYLAHRFRQGKFLTLFYDELRSVIDRDELTHGLLQLWRDGAQGLYHLGGPVKVSLYDIGKYVIARNGYDPACLIRASRFDDESGLPRIGDVSLNSQRAYECLDSMPNPWPSDASFNVDAA